MKTFSIGRGRASRAATEGLLAVALMSGADACGGADVKPAGCIELADGRCVVSTFENPAVLAPDANGVYQLRLQPTELTFEGQRHCGRGYNGVYPAPTIETPAAKIGESRQVRVDLRNGFTKSDVRSLSSDPSCTCTDLKTGASCVPDHAAGSTCTCLDSQGQMCHAFDFNLTNLHAHGSHVRPNFATGGGCVEKDGLSCRSCNDDRTVGARECYFADDVLQHVKPGEGVQHRWDIDEDGVHHAGLDWYHPHIHGSTAIQVAGGATGAWIVRGALDEIPGIKAAKERIMLITTPPLDFAPLADGEPCDEDHITFDDFETLAATSGNETNLVNGLRRPRIVMPPGQIERWRFLHGSFLDEITIALFRGKDSDCKSLDLASGPVALTQIGRDGIPLPKPRDGVDWPFAPPYIFMAPGYRVEALLDGSKLKHGDTLCLMSGRDLQEDTTGAPPASPTPEEILKAASNGDLIAIVNVSSAAGTPTETKMPDLSAVAAEAPSMMLKDGTVDGLARCQAAEAETDPAKIDQLAAMWLVFYNNDKLDKCGFPDHNLNCKNFEDTDRSKYPYDRVLTKGQVDHWRLLSGFDGHPFHIHIDPFLVCPLPPAGSMDKNAKSRLFEPPFAHFRDTYLVNLDRTVDVLEEYRFTGSFVYHCHKLTHEDHGMMELLHVCDPSVESCDTLCSGGPCGWRSCAAGDASCERALVATECLVDPSRCPEAALRCTPCSASQSCPVDAHCSTQPALDGALRCEPGCVVSSDCGPTEQCDAAGACVPAPVCAPPCGPPETCLHGACG